MENVDENKTNLEKDKVQDKAVELSSTNPVLLLTFATGVGKSLAAIKIIESNPDTEWYILCEEINHVTNWILEFKKHNKEPLLKNVKIFCYHSLHKYLDNKVNLILDEAAVTVLRLQQIRQIAGDKIIVLAAIIGQMKKDMIRMIRGEYKEYHISISDAIEKGLLPYPKVYTVEIPLDKEESRYVFVWCRGDVKKRKTVYCNYVDVKKMLAIYQDVNLYIMCTAYQKYHLIGNQILKYKNLYFQLGQDWAKFTWLNYASQRKRFLADYKTETAEKLLLHLRKKRLICFCGSIRQANYLGDNNIVHSQNKDKKQNSKVIHNFNMKTINTIFAVNMLRKSMNLEGIEAGVIVQLDNQKLSFIQMLGRIFRSVMPECYIIKVNNTIDDTYLETVLEGFDRKYLHKFDTKLLD